MVPNSGHSGYIEGRLEGGSKRRMLWEPKLWNSAA